MSEYRPTECVVDFGDCRSNRFVGLNMTLIKQNGAKLQERIVRCSDCVFFAADVETVDERGEQIATGNLCEWTGLWVEPNGFCSWAERRDA